MRIWIGMAAAMTVASVCPAAAQERAVRISANAIADGDYAGAERRLIAEQRIFPDRPEVLLNLAAVYANTGRQAQASSLYRQVLAQPDVLMDLDATHSRSSHAIANKGMERLDIRMTAAR